MYFVISSYCYFSQFAWKYNLYISFSHQLMNWNHVVHICNDIVGFELYNNFDLYIQSVVNEIKTKTFY